ncbi:PQQ-dependent sugar dehydrogenase [Methylocystis parvus]|uniref:Sorbosone dehydrogenase n=1 Tax=Methylocystis parvus TaxID=134 RepID=A0A6B8M6W4_9HYPH|nr:PQQ-dependent sugar dehydrogenase [Methylocystis parvus]QGM98238.1 sorbosone dehydrogenase [Methylocystis parvus]WBK01436.1 PQQ-dependent sugar dehydrogenase [Methylocystis parvus OBBP]
MRKLFRLALVSIGAATAVYAFAGRTRAPDPAVQRREIEATLARIKLPPGFSISLYALAPNARTLAIGREGKAIFVGTDEKRAYVITPGKDSAKSVDILSPSESLVMPHGVCLSDDGALFLVERNRVTRIDDAENRWREAGSIAKIIVKAGDLIPRSEESRGHAARVCKVGPDGKVYIALGQPHNVAPRDRLALYDRTGMGGIVRMNADGSGREVFATGLRNSVGLAFDRQGRLWFTDNQVDGMGDDIPPGEINRADGPGFSFGFPWYGGGHVRTHEYAKDAPPEGLVFPQVEEAAHAADLGLTFYRGDMFPSEYCGGIFSAQHGSWDRSAPIGARLMFTKLGPNGDGGVTTPFAEGWNTGQGAYLGRPVDVAELADGSLLVTDDQNGAIYRISYRAK